MKILEKLALIGIPTRTAPAAIQYMRDHRWFEKTDDEYKDLIIELAMDDVPTEDSRELNYTFRYLVTMAIEHPGHTGKATLALAYEKAKTFIANHQYVFATPDEDDEPKLDAIGNVKPKKGAKKELARKVYDEKIRNKDVSRKDAIAILMEDVGMSAGGASTYYANLKKGTM